MKKLKKLVKNQDGSVLIIVALAMVVLLGFAALVVDLGTVYVEKAKLQNAADAAALAGAIDLPDENTAKSTAISYAGKNGVHESDTIPTTPYEENSTMIEVVCKGTVSNIFARIFGEKFKTTDISVKAVAQKSQWDGDVLPFINMAGNFSDGINIWDKVDAGLFESIKKDDVENDGWYFKVNYQNGVLAKDGKLAEGSDNIKTSLQDMWNKYTPGDHVYIFSFSNTVFSNHYVVTDSGKKSFEQEYKNKPYQELGTDDNIHLNQLVLLECTWNSYSINDKTLNVTYCKTYDLGNNTGVDLPDFPTDYVDPYGNSSILVK